MRPLRAQSTIHLRPIPYQHKFAIDVRPGRRKSWQNCLLSAENIFTSLLKIAVCLRCVSVVQFASILTLQQTGLKERPSTSSKRWCLYGFEFPSLSQDANNALSNRDQHDPHNAEPSLGRIHSSTGLSCRCDAICEASIAGILLVSIC